GRGTGAVAGGGGRGAGCGGRRLAAVRVRDGRGAGAGLRDGRARVRGRAAPPARAGGARGCARGARALRLGGGSTIARQRQTGRRRGVVPARDCAGRAGRRGARRLPGAGRRAAGPGRRGGGPGELPAGAGRGRARRHDRPAGPGQDQRAGARGCAAPAAPAVRILCRVAFAAGAAVALACHHGPRVAPAPDPAADLARARALFRRGDFGGALKLFQRLTYELGAADSLLPEVRYSLAECYFQTGDRVQAAHEFRDVADRYPTSEYAPLALLRAGDANLRLWRRPELDPTYGENALAIYQELAGRYPGTAAAARAQLHVQQLREWFAEKDYKNGMFYFRRHAYDSGIIYFK